MQAELISGWVSTDEVRQFLTLDAANATLYHFPDFLNYHGDKFPDARRVQLSVRKDNKLMAFMPGAIRETDGRRIFISPFAASYGGWAFRRGLIFSEIEEVIHQSLDCLRLECDGVRITPPCEIHAEDRNQALIEYLLLGKGFQISRSEVVLSHRTGHSSQLLERLDSTARRAVKQPLFQHQLELRVTPGMDSLAYGMMSETQSRLGGVPTHTLEEVERIEATLPGTVITFMAWKDGIPLAGITAFRVNSRVLNTFYIYDSAEGRPFKANHFIYYKVIEYAGENGYAFADFGPSTFGWEPNRSLIGFKEKFANEPYLRHTFEQMWGQRTA